MTIPYYKPAKLYPAYPESPAPKVLGDFRAICDSGFYTKGHLSSKLALAIAERTHYKHAIAVGSGTAAQFILARWYWSQGFRKIRVPAFTWPSTYQPFVWTGYQVRFVDIDRKTWLVDFGDFGQENDELLIPVDTFGSSHEGQGLQCVHPIVDSAQSLGAVWREKMNRIVSLSGSKILTSGEGGILLTQDEDLAKFAWNQSWFSRLPELSASLGLAYLEQFDSILKRKAEIAARYRERFPNLEWQVIPYSTNFYVVAALVDSPRDWERANPEVEYRKYYSAIVSETDEETPFETANLHLPNTEYVSRRILAFPSWPDLPLEVIENMKEP